MLAVVTCGKAKDRERMRQLVSGLEDLTEGVQFLKEEENFWKYLISVSETDMCFVNSTTLGEPALLISHIKMTESHFFFFFYFLF